MVPSGRSLGLWGCALEGDYGTMVSSSSLLPGHEVSSLALPHVPAIMCCPAATGPNQWGQQIMAYNLQNCGPQISVL